MKRCVICDSTDQFDVLEDLGFSTPITSWHVLDDPHGGDCCNRCFEVIQDTLLEQELEEENNNPVFGITPLLEDD